MKKLETYLEEYLQTRRALGYKMNRTEHDMGRLIDFINEEDEQLITPDLCYRWATHSGTASKRNGSLRFGRARRFATYVSIEDPRHEAPSQYMVPYPKIKKKPVYIYEENEVLKLMNATSIFNRGTLKLHTYRVVIGLLASTGMRVGEVVNLNCDDFDPEKEKMLIRQPKDNKDRFVYLHSTAIQEIQDYIARRDKHRYAPRTDALFVSHLGTRLIYDNIHANFVKLLKHTGLINQKPRPRIHDLRHTFIIRTIQRWYSEGKNVEACLSQLSTYVGHKCPSSTYWYLNATPELMACAAKNLEESWEVYQ